MQGPYDPQPGRRAGDSSRMSASPQQELKDWQRNATWVGPVPVNPDPFDEPENSPELEDERSKNVREHAGEFWDEIPMQGYETRSIPVLQQGKTAQRAEGKRERRISLRNVGIIAGVLVSILLILYFAVFRIREIRVIGNEDISTADVIRFSGMIISITSENWSRPAR